MNQPQVRSPAFYLKGCDWLHHNCAPLLPEGVGTYRVRMLRNANTVHPVLGVAIAPPTLEGRLVHIGDSFAVLQEGADCFTVFDFCMLGLTAPPLNSRITLTPYRARDFDGVSLYELPAAERDGNKTLLGKRRCVPPVDPQSDYLKHLVDQLAHMPAPDGVRSIAESLVDAGARRSGVSIQEDPAEGLYSITFTVSSGIFDGTLTIGYLPGKDLYWIKLAEKNEKPVVIEDVYFDMLGEIIDNAIDDARWMAADITVLEAGEACTQAA